jgi:hypothetical protein
MKSESGLRCMALEFAVRIYSIGSSTNDVVERAEAFLKFLKGVKRPGEKPKK